MVPSEILTFINTIDIRNTISILIIKRDILNNFLLSFLPSIFLDFCQSLYIHEGEIHASVGIFPQLLRYYEIFRRHMRVTVISVNIESVDGFRLQHTQGWK